MDCRQHGAVLCPGDFDIDDAMGRDVSAPLALTGKPTAELIPGCRLKVYPGAPHGLMYTHMEVLNGDILQFIRAT